MKTNFLLTTVLFILFSMVTGNIHAQKKLDEVVNKIENMDDVDVNFVKNRNQQTRKIKVVKTYTVKSKVLVDQILDAFEQDKEDAITMIENKQGGRILPSLYSFNKNGNKVSYTFSLFNDGNGATLTLLGGEE